MSNEVIHLEAKLENLRKRYINASPAMKKWLEVGAGTIKHRLEYLKKKELVKSTPKLI